MEPEIHPSIARHPAYRRALDDLRQAENAYSNYNAQLRQWNEQHQRQMSNWRARMAEAATEGDFDTLQALQADQPAPLGDAQLQADLQFAQG